MTCQTFSARGNSSGDSEKEFDEVAWHGGNSKQMPHPVGEKKPNHFGIYDMHGNVWEWCEDWHTKDYYASSPVNDPPGSPSGLGRVLRGGSSGNNPKNCRAAHRFSFSPTYQNRYGGFRIVVLPRRP